MRTVQLTPVEGYGPIYAKRDDLWEERGPDGVVLARGAKARTAGLLLRSACAQGYGGIVLGTARNSSVPGMVARMAAAYGLGMQLHIPAAARPYSPEVAAAVQAGVELHEERPGYMSVIASRARAAATERGWYHIPLGLEHQLGVDATAAQVVGLPAGVRRIVCSVGSGMMLAGVLWGLHRQPAAAVPVLGITVGQDPRRRLARYAPPPWEQMVELQPAAHGFHDEVEGAVGSLRLDPVYEAKCAALLQPGDLLWIVAHRDTN